MNVNFSPIDSISVVILLVAYFKGREEAARQKKLDIQWARAKETEAAWKAIKTPHKNIVAQDADEAAGTEPGALSIPEKEIRAAKDLIAAQAFSSWIGSRSFAMALSCSLIGLFFGHTTLPGAFIGLMLSSPRLMGLLAAGLGTLMGN